MDWLYSSGNKIIRQDRKDNNEVKEKNRKCESKRWESIQQHMREQRRGGEEKLCSMQVKRM